MGVRGRRGCTWLGFREAAAHGEWVVGADGQVLDRRVPRGSLVRLDPLHLLAMREQPSQLEQLQGPRVGAERQGTFVRMP